MKYLLIIPCLCVFTYAISQGYRDKAMSELADIGQKCIQETGADEVDITQLMEKKPPSRKVGKCLVACFYKEMGIMKNGKVDKDGSMKIIEPLKEDDANAYSKALAVMNKVGEEMASVDEKDECEYAMKLSDCTTKVAKELNVNLEEFMA